MARGDFREARALATGLLGSDDEALREAARATLDRLRLDPVVLGVFAATGVVMAALAALYLGHRH